MIKPFFTLVGMLVFLVLVIVGHYFSYERGVYEEANSKIVAVTNISSPSLSVAYYEPRVLFAKRATNPAYPQMQPINRTGFIYEK